jgi:5' nucleotidase, deoxy (Pyrimidine), cytosolic type C protein (NT5C)
MIPLRIGFDMDGTLADFRSAFAQVQERLFGRAVAADDEAAPEVREHQQHAGSAADTTEEPRRSDRRLSRHLGPGERERVWQVIEGTPDFWTTLQPVDARAITRLNQLTDEYHWEVFFITQRPATAGRTVQWQTFKWLVDHGFQTPSVIPLSGSRGQAASALQLDFLVDDTPQNCVDVLADSSARAILLVDADDRVARDSARLLGIGTAVHIHDALDLLVEATTARSDPSLFEKLRKLAGWK